MTHSHSMLTSKPSSPPTQQAHLGVRHVNTTPLGYSRNVIFKVAKRRCYTHVNSGSGSSESKPNVINLVDDDEGEDGEEDAWDALDEIEGRVGVKESDKGKGKEKRKSWIPDEMNPVLEELPKWNLLADVLEIEEEMMRGESSSGFRPSCKSPPQLMIVISYIQS